MIRNREFYDERIDVLGLDFDGCLFDGCVMVSVEDGSPSTINACRFKDCLFEGDGWPIWMDGYKQPRCR